MATPTFEPTFAPTFEPTFAPTFEPTSSPSIGGSDESIFNEVNAYIAVICSLLACACIFIINGYKEPDFPWYTQISIFVGYFSTFGIMLLVPIDVANVVIARREGIYSNTASAVLETSYNVFFTTILVLGSVWLCIEEYYNNDGYFTVLSRFLSAIKRFLLDTFVGFIAGLIILGILIAQKIVSSNADALMLAAQVTTNILYQFFLVMLLAYGLVQYPLSFWKCSNLDDYFTVVQMEISQNVKDISDNYLNSSLAVSDVLKTKDALLSTDSKNEELQNAMKILVSECPEEFRSSRLGKVAADKDGKITIHTLAELRTRLNSTKSIFRMSQSKCAKSRILAYKLEDIIAARDKNANFITWSLEGTFSTPGEKNWLCTYRGWWWKVCSILLGLLSLLSFIGVCNLYSTVDMKSNPFFNAINGATNAAAIVIFIWFTFGYTLYVTMWSLFQMSFAGSMDLAPGQTTPLSLSFNVRMVARLAAPLAFFYMGWIGENGIRDGYWTHYEGDEKNEVVLSSFAEFYNIASVHAVKESVGIVFPTILIIFMILMITGLLNRFLVYCKLDSYQIGAKTATEELLREGKKHLQKEKKATIKAYQRGTLRSGLFSRNRPDGDTSYIGRLVGTCFGKKAEKGLAFEDVMKDGPASSKEDSFRQSLASSNASSISAPAIQQGNLEKKEGSIKAAWVEMYAKISESASLKIFRQVKVPAPTTKPDMTYDLKLAMQISKKVDKEGSQLEITFATEVVRLRFKTPADMDSWKASADAWKQFSIENPDFDYDSASRDNCKQSDVDLNAVNVTDLESGLKKKSGTSSSNRGQRSGSDNGEESGLVSDKPEKLEGWVEKKSESKMGLGSEWQRRYVRIDEKAGTMVYYKSANTSDKPQGVIDLKMVADISAYSKGGAKEDPSRFNMDMGDGGKVYKWKTATIEEGIKWTKGLCDWRDYFLLEMK